MIYESCKMRTKTLQNFLKTNDIYVYAITIIIIGIKTILKREDKDEYKRETRWKVNIEAKFRLGDWQLTRCQGKAEELGNSLHTPPKYRYNSSTASTTSFESIAITNKPDVPLKKTRQTPSTSFSHRNLSSAVSLSSKKKKKKRRRRKIHSPFPWQSRGKGKNRQIKVKLTNRVNRW